MKTGNHRLFRQDLFHGWRPRSPFATVWLTVARGRGPAALVLAGLVLVGTVAERSAAGAQSPAAGRGRSSQAAASSRSTRNGVYTTAQAARGEETYASICVSCHPVITYTGETFRSHWEGRTVFDLFDEVSQKMPKNEPGSLSAKEY